MIFSSETWRVYDKCWLISGSSSDNRNARVLLNSVTASNETDFAREALASNVSTNYIEMVTADAFQSTLNNLTDFVLWL